MSYETFLDLTPEQFTKAYELFIAKTNKDREAAERTAWEVARWQVWRTLCPPKGDRLSLLDLLTLTGEKKEVKTIKPDRERAQKLAERWKD
jgi:hypothetical protein